MLKHNSCILCGNESLIPLKDFSSKHDLVRCAKCGLVFMARIPSAEELNEHYSRYSYNHHAELSPITVKSYNLLLDEFEKCRVKNKILDVGCGRGWFLLEAQKRGWEVYGTEYSETAVSLCESKGLRMKYGKLSSDSFNPGEFDVITSFEVLEHINNPNEEVALFNRFLRDGGLFYCTTPNFNCYLRYYLKADYNIIEYPEHLTYYTRRTLKKLLNRHGFVSSKVLTTGISITRFSTSLNPAKPKPDKSISSDEILRQKISAKWYLGYIKSFVNRLLSLCGLGMTLKGYFFKRIS